MVVAIDRDRESRTRFKRWVRKNRGPGHPTSLATRGGVRSRNHQAGRRTNGFGTRVESSYSFWHDAYQETQKGARRVRGRVSVRVRFFAGLAKLENATGLDSAGCPIEARPGAGSTPAATISSLSNRLRNFARRAGGFGLIVRAVRTIVGFRLCPTPMRKERRNAGHRKESFT